MSVDKQLAEATEQLAELVRVFQAALPTAVSMVQCWAAVRAINATQYGLGEQDEHDARRAAWVFLRQFIENK